MPHYPRFDTVRIDANGQRIHQAVTINVFNVTQNVSLGTISSTLANGAASVPAGTFSANNEDVIEYSHATYTGKLRHTLKANSEAAFYAAENKPVFVLQDLLAKSKSVSADLYINDPASTEPATLLGSGKRGQTLLLPVQTGVAKNFEIFPISVDETEVQERTNFLTTNKATVAVPAIGDSGVIADDSVTDAKLAEMPTMTIKGNNAGVTANPVNLTATQARTVIDAPRKFLTTHDQTGLNAALTAIGSTTAELIIRENVAVTSGTTIPINVLVNFEGTGGFTVSSGITLAIRNAAPMAAKRYFFGAGKVLLDPNATGGRVKLEWWAGNVTSGDDRLAMQQAVDSCAAGLGGIIEVGMGVWNWSGIQPYSGTTIQGAGRGQDMAAYSGPTEGTTVKCISGDTFILKIHPRTGDSYPKNIQVKDIGLSVGTLAANCVYIGGIQGTGTAYQNIFENVAFQGYATSGTQRLVEINGSEGGSQHWEAIGTNFINCFWQVAKTGTGLYGNTVNSSVNVLMPTYQLDYGLGSKAIEWGGGPGWLTVINPDTRGNVSSYNSPQTFERTLTSVTVTAPTKYGVYDNVHSLMTVNTGTLTRNDLGKAFSITGANSEVFSGYITEVLTATTAMLSWHPTGAYSNFVARSCNLSTWGLQTGIGGTFLHVFGDSASVKVIGGADEGINYTWSVGTGTLRSRISFENYSAQGRCVFTESVNVATQNCQFYSLAFEDNGTAGDIIYNGINDHVWRQCVYPSVYVDRGEKWNKRKTGDTTRVVHDSAVIEELVTYSVGNVPATQWKVPTLLMESLNHRGSYGELTQPQESFGVTSASTTKRLTAWGESDDFRPNGPLLHSVYLQYNTANKQLTLYGTTGTSYAIAVPLFIDNLTVNDLTGVNITLSGIIEATNISGTNTGDETATRIRTNIWNPLGFKYNVLTGGVDPLGGNDELLLNSTEGVLRRTNVNILDDYLFDRTRLGVYFDSYAIKPTAIGSTDKFYLYSGTSGEGFRAVTFATLQSAISGASSVLSTVLTGLSTASATVVTASHTILEAFGFLQAQVTARVIGNSAITAATKTKVTYDTKGLVTSGADATTADIADSSNKRYVTDAQLTVIGNTSGTNSGNETVVTMRSLINTATNASAVNSGDEIPVGPTTDGTNMRKHSVSALAGFILTRTTLNNTLTGSSPTNKSAPDLSDWLHLSSTANVGSGTLVHSTIAQLAPALDYRPIVEYTTTTTLNLSAADSGKEWFFTAAPIVNLPASSGCTAGKTVFYLFNNTVSNIDAARNGTDTVSFHDLATASGEINAAAVRVLSGGFAEIRYVATGKWRVTGSGIGTA